MCLYIMCFIYNKLNLYILIHSSIQNFDPHHHMKDEKRDTTILQSGMQPVKEKSILW